ncbi:MAG: glycosyltransferase [Gammaproteobacteria bacterium]|nr:glycosyltransferase [Gammaproteobacteria bacterium]
MLSIIIPAIDESVALPQLLEQLRLQQGVEVEVILADGGSTDNTKDIAKAMGAKVVESPPGRGLQMNRAVAVSRGDWLLFLHADSGLTDEHQLLNALSSLQARIERADHQRLSGHFRLCFRRERGGSGLAYRYYEEKSALNRSECTNGDQGFLLSRSFFDELGGFDESLWFLEDQRLAEAIRLKGEWITLPDIIMTSARRLEQEGMLRRMILSALIMNFHAIGLHEFFLRAASVYRNQSDTGQLCMAPIFSLIRELNREAGVRISAGRWIATGCYVLGHMWQIFFWFDVVLQPLLNRRRPMLWLYDHLLLPVYKLRLFCVISACFVWLWFHLSWAVFSVIDKGRE